MAKLRNFDWRNEANDLIRTQDEKLWQSQNATSFSDWLKIRATQEGIRISLLWRYLRVGRFAVELDVGEWGKVASPMDIPAGISADSIELLEKINRAATVDDFKIIANDLYQKKITRPQLLRTWQIYREAMPTGKTARGRGTLRPVLSENDENKLLIAIKQSAFKKLEHVNPVSLGYEEGLEIKIVNAISSRKKSYGYDAILVARAKDSIVDIALVIFYSDKEAYQKIVAQFSKDRLWLIYQANESMASSIGAKHPDAWGVIVLEGTELSIAKPILRNSNPIPFPINELLLDLIRP